MTLKQKIHQHYLLLIDEKINRLQQLLADLKETGSNETKSTAGDKHETALAMIQIEQANARTQLKEMQEQKAVLEKINPLLSSGKIINGSLIETNRGWLYLSIALGRITAEGITVTALSAQSPLGKKLLGLTAGGGAEINNNQYLVETVL
jgi:transcription elongation GreA/GreB family factor